MFRGLHIVPDDSDLPKGLGGIEAVIQVADRLQGDS